MNQDNFDDLFENSFDDAAQIHKATPDHASSWSKMQRRLVRKQKQNKMLSSVWKVSIIAAALVLGTYFFNSPNQTKAYFPFFTSIKNLSDNLATFVFGSKDSDDNIIAKTSPPPGVVQDHETNKKNPTFSMPTKELVSYEEAAGRVSFQLPTIGYTADTYSLRNTIIYSTEPQQKVDQLTLNYISSEGKTYKIVLNKLNKDSTVNTTSNTDAGEIQKINLNSGTGYLTVVKNDLVNLDFMLGDVVIIIIGDLPKEEVIKIANSIK